MLFRSVYGVNSALFNDPDNKTYNNMKEAKKEMLTQVILPELVLLRDAFNRFFAAEMGKDYYIDFDITIFPELQEDMKSLPYKIINSNGKPKTRADEMTLVISNQQEIKPSVKSARKSSNSVPETLQKG